MRTQEINSYKPEERVEIILSEWFTDFKIPFWFNRFSKSLKNDNIFYTKGLMEKPDLVIFSDKYPINGYIAIEVKTSNNSKDIYDSSKILKYLKNYNEGKTKYFINNKEIKIKLFIVATENSIEGKLFNEIEKETPDINSKWHKILLETKNEPLFEFSKTKHYLRQLWATWRQIIKRNNNEVGCGILLSSALNEGINYKIPYIFCQLNYKGFYDKKERWHVRWIQL